MVFMQEGHIFDMVFMQEGHIFDMVFMQEGYIFGMVFMQEGHIFVNSSLSDQCFISSFIMQLVFNDPYLFLFCLYFGIVFCLV